MLKIIKKEMKLSASILSYFFIAFGLMFFLPGYPILCGAFFISLGIFQSFQNALGSNDIVFSALLPIAKKDIVKGKYLFSCIIELCGFCIMIIATLVRMTILKDSVVYRNNALMNANPFALGMALVIFSLFNSLFIGGFFKTAYKYLKPFVSFTIITFAVIFAAEALHYIPGLKIVNAFGFENFGIQVILLGMGALVFVLLTTLSYKRSCRNFEKIDL